MFGAINIQDTMAGGRHESHLEGYSEEIKSKSIISFSYSGRYFGICAKKNGKKVEIHASGGGRYNVRDGSYFIIRYDTEDDSIFKELQDVIDKYNEVKGNGYCLTVDGLPSGIGDIFNVEYESGEKIYKYSNQYCTVGDEAANEFYEIFHKYVKKEGYDFNSAGSNVKLFDDADKEYVQGTWKGKHFGRELVVTFDGDYVTIVKDGKTIINKEKYTIFEGAIKPDKLKEGKEKAESSYDYEDFDDTMTSMKKKNWFTMVAYFCREGAYSTCELMNFDKEKPKEE